jgi:hypothetical protein
MRFTIERLSPTPGKRFFWVLWQDARYVGTYSLKRHAIHATRAFPGVAVWTEVRS